MVSLDQAVQVFVEQEMREYMESDQALKDELVIQKLVNTVNKQRFHSQKRRRMHRLKLELRRK